MIIRKYLKKNLKIQFFKLIIFAFMAYVIHFVFKTRSIYVFYAFVGIFSALYAFTIVKILFYVIRFYLKTKALDKKRLEEEFFEAKKYCNQFFVLKNYLLVLRCGFSDVGLNIFKIEDIKEISKQKLEKGNGDIIFITQKGDKNKMSKLYMFSDDDKVKKEFEEFYNEICERIKEN